MNFETVFLGLGTNIGERRKNLEFAIDHLDKLKNVTIEKVSKVYETSPMYYSAQDDFLNQVLQINTSYPPEELLKEVKQIEVDAGREFVPFRNSPRVLDIDILAYESTTVISDILTVPHRGIPTRKFVLIPWADIAPDFIPPGHPYSIKLMLRKINDNSIVKPYVQQEKVLR